VRVVLDTNVLFAARVSRSGVPAQLVRLAREGRCELIVSALLLDELSEVLARKKAGLDAAEVAAYVAELGECTMVEDPAAPGRWSRDPDDDYLVGLALAAEADALVTGDRDLLHLIEAPLPVLTPRAFLDRLQQASERADD
jgi:putative PIN family toxin of toxin-antitoxin system